MRFSAPPHVSEVTLSTGPFAVIDGILEVPDDTPTADFGGLSVNGFVLMSAVLPEPAKTKPIKPSAAAAAAPESDAEEHPADEAKND